MRQWLWLSSVSRAVASNARGPRFKSSYQQNIKLDIYVLTVNYIEKTKNKEKEAGNGPFFRKKEIMTIPYSEETIPFILFVKFSLYLKNMNLAN